MQGFFLMWRWWLRVLGKVKKMPGLFIPGMRGCLMAASELASDADAYAVGKLLACFCHVSVAVVYIGFGCGAKELVGDEDVPRRGDVIADADFGRVGKAKLGAVCFVAFSA